MSDDPNMEQDHEPSVPSEGAEAGLEVAGGRAADAGEQRFVFTPPIDIYETDDGLMLCADLPGVTIDTLELQVQDNRLTLFGRVLPHTPEGAVPRHQEFQVGDFLRSFILSDGVDYDRITAKLNNGVLRLSLPRAAESKPRRIAVNVD